MKGSSGSISRLRVTHLDNHLLVVEKPAGLLSQADETGDTDLLAIGKSFLKARFKKPGKVFLGLVHRLDRPTSGLMVLARTSKAASRLSAQFREHSIEKRYLAIVEGEPPPSEHWQDFLEKRERQSHVVRPGRGKLASLRYRLLGSRGGISLVDVALETGRHHQIRVQFSSRGFPLLGDLRYGGTRTFENRNLALHCYLLALDHPTQKNRLTFTARPGLHWGLFASEIEDFFGELDARFDGTVENTP